MIQGYHAFLKRTHKQFAHRAAEAVSSKRLRSYPAPVNRIVLLGASNLTYSLWVVIETAQLICGRPSEFLIAASHGRAYGVGSQVLFRGLPGIAQCGLWEDLAKGPQLPTYALLTDLGNDIAYGQPPERLVECVRWCLDRLVKCHARIVVTTLPVPSLELLKPWQYRLLRMLLFPGRNLSQEQALERARTVNEALREYCRDQGIALIEQRLEWYGLDPIHIRRGARAMAYRTVLTPWLEPGHKEPPLAQVSFCPQWRGWFFAPQYQRLLGLSLYRSQPTGLLPDGSTVSLY